MARNGGSRGGGDRILESRHLVGFFLGVVLLCGVFFTLGYTIGRNDYSASAANRVDSLATPPRPQPKQPVTKPADSASPSSQTPSEWDFYTKQDQNHLEPATKSAPAAAVPSAPASDAPLAYDKPAATSIPVHYRPPKLQKNSIVLQLAALRRQSDAMALADELQQKRFPSFVLTPTTDGFYRVQVGPYSNEADAENAKRALDREGFKAIIKR